MHDPFGELVLCASSQAAYTMVNGRIVVRQGQLTNVELEPLIETHNRLALQLALETPTTQAPGRGPIGGVRS